MQSLVEYEQQSKMKRRKLNEQEQLAANRLRQLVTEAKHERKLTQRDISRLMGMSPGGANQYINGLIPLNYPAALRFANVLGCTVNDILGELLPERRLTEKESGLQRKFDRLNAKDQALILQQISNLLNDE